MCLSTFSTLNFKFEIHFNYEEVFFLKKNKESLKNHDNKIITEFFSLKIENSVYRASLLYSRGGNAETTALLLN